MAMLCHIKKRSHPRVINCEHSKKNLLNTDEIEKYLTVYVGIGSTPQFNARKTLRGLQ
jgi:hypothetical protein